MSRVLDWDITVPYRWTTGPVFGLFLGGLKEKKIFGAKCSSCSKVYVPPQDTCPACLEDFTEDSFVEVKPEGEVISFTKIVNNFFGERPTDDYLNTRIRPVDVEEHPLLWPPDVPYAVALIKLDGADTSLAHLVKGSDMDKLKVGTKVKAVWEDERIGHILDIERFQIIG